MPSSKSEEFPDLQNPGLVSSEVNQDIVVEAMFRSSSGHFHSSRKYCKIFIFYNFTNLCVLHGQVFVMILRFYITFDFVGLGLKLVLRAVGQGLKLDRTIE